MQDSTKANTVSEQQLDSFGKLFGEAWSLFKSRAWVLMGIYALPIIVSLVAFFIPKNFITLIPLFILFLLEIILSIAGSIAIIYAVSGNGGIAESYGKSFGVFWKYLWVGLLTGLVVMGGFVMGIIPGFIFMVWFGFAYYVLLLEDKRGIGALLRSKEYISGYWWGVLGRSLLFLLILFVSGAIIGLFRLINPYVQTVLIYAFEVVAVPFLVAFTFRLYENLVRIKSQLASAPVAGNKRFFEFAGWLGLLTPLALVVIVPFLFNPSALLQQARDSSRVQDALNLNNDINMWMSDVIVNRSNWKPGYYCSGGTGSFPGGGTCNVSESTSTDGTGWLPIDFNLVSFGSPIQSLPIDSENNQDLCRASGGYCYYAVQLDQVLGKYQIYVPLESSQYQNKYGTGNLPGWYEISNGANPGNGTGL